MDTETIKDILGRYGHIKSEYALLMAFDKSHNEQLRRLRRQLDTIDAWYALMTQEERFVIERHFTGKLSWPYIEVEYAQQWGQSMTRNERTLKRYQASALRKIQDSVRKHNLDDAIGKLFTQAPYPHPRSGRADRSCQPPDSRSLSRS